MAQTTWKWGRIAKLAIEGEPLFLPSLSETLGRRSRRLIDRGAAQGIPNSHLLSYWYAKGRLRYWFGQQSFHASRPIAQFDPLYNVYLMAAAHRTDFARRRANMIGLEAMRQLDAELLEYPFYNDDLPSAGFLKENPKISKRPFSERPYRYRRLEFSPVARLRVDLRRDKVTTEDIGVAEALSLKPEDISGLRKWGRVAYDEVSNSAVSEFVSRKALQGMLCEISDHRPTVSGAVEFLGALFRAGVIAPEQQTLEDEFIFAQ